MEKSIYNLIILDESGSMSVIQRSAVNGVQRTISSIRDFKNDGTELNQYLTLVSFNGSGKKVIYDAEPIKNVRNYRYEDFNPDDNTPLYDAIGYSLKNLENQIRKDDVVYVTIITDGEENSSRKYDAHDICTLIGQLKEHNWIFTYIGANQDSVMEARRMNIGNAMNFVEDEEGTEKMFLKENKIRNVAYNFITDANFSPECAKKLNEDLFKEDDSNEENK